MWNRHPVPAQPWLPAAFILTVILLELYDDTKKRNKFSSVKPLILYRMRPRVRLDSFR
jgi:hypothetical protein